RHGSEHRAFTDTRLPDDDQARATLDRQRHIARELLLAAGRLEAHVPQLDALASYDAELPVTRCRLRIHRAEAFHDLREAHALRRYAGQEWNVVGERGPRIARWRGRGDGERDRAVFDLAAEVQRIDQE